MKKLILFLFCAMSLSASADHKLLFMLKDGTTHEFLFGQKPYFRITLDQVVLTSDILEATYLFREIDRYVIIDTETDVAPVKEATFRYAFADGILTLGGCKKAEVYSEDGQLVKASKGESQITLNDVSNGMYIVKTDAKTFKIIKK